jgi:hypothetical protein
LPQRIPYLDDERRELLATEELSKRLAERVVPRRQSASMVQQLGRITGKSNTTSGLPLGQMGRGHTWPLFLGNTLVVSLGGVQRRTANACGDRFSKKDCDFAVANVQSRCGIRAWMRACVMAVSVDEMADSPRLAG